MGGHLKLVVVLYVVEEYWKILYLLNPRPATQRRVTNNYILKPIPVKFISFINVAGSNGQKINLSANYFNLIHAAQWSLYQYHVVMEPQDDRTKEKKGMFSTAVKDIVSGFIFDGTTMYSPVRLPQKETEVFAKDDAEVVTKINIKLVSEVTPFDYHYLQVFNILIRKCMSHLKLQLVQRNYYDAKAKVITISLHFVVHYKRCILSDCSSRASHRIMARLHYLYKTT